MFTLIFDHEYGALNNYVMAPLGIEKIRWLRDPAFVMPSIIIVGLWKYTGINTLYFLVGLQNIPTEIREAALIDGASPVQRFVHVTLPMLKPILTFGFGALSDSLLVHHGVPECSVRIRVNDRIYDSDHHFCALIAPDEADGNIQRGTMMQFPTRSWVLSRGWSVFTYLLLFVGLVIATFPFLNLSHSDYNFPAEHITASRIVINLLACSAAAYAFAKYRFPFKNLLFLLVIGFLMIPPQITVVPLFLLMNGFGWLDTLYAVTLPGAFTAFGVFFLRQVMVASVPTEILESARMDGASEYRTFFQLVLRLPAVSSGLIVLMTLTFVNTWNEYFWPVVALRSSEKFTLPVGLATLVGMYRVEYGMLMAGGFMAVLPIILIFLIGRKAFIQGFTAGAVKG